ncbi:MAG: 3,4-dihydroxy-2-butanone-4-phosphate synthase [Candidatus Polarisedimenticolia bacterium]|nr:3,4-dihydroxy-2-butanone-4-phosphate synthase [bacterium]
MTSLLTARCGAPRVRLERAIESLAAGRGILVVDDEDRENEVDMVFAAETLTEEQMALLIREGSGIVCLCLTPERTLELKLPQMSPVNTNHHGTAFTVSIEAARGVTTGVSAADRVATVRAAVADDARPEDLARPGHVFPLRARPGGVLERRGHTEAVVDLARLAGLRPCGVLCELTKPDGTMARLPDALAFGESRGLPIVAVDDVARLLSKAPLGD